MPIKPQMYPPYWRQFSVWVRKIRAGNRCERCFAPNGKMVYRGFLEDGLTPVWVESWSGATFHADSGQYYGEHAAEHLVRLTTVKIVLTVAHLENLGDVCQCRRIRGRKCAKPAHVQALCQRCHLAYDRAMHVRRRRERTIREKDARRGLLNL